MSDSWIQFFLTTIIGILGLIVAIVCLIVAIVGVIVTIVNSFHKKKNITNTQLQQNDVFSKKNNRSLPKWLYKNKSKISNAFLIVVTCLIILIFFYRFMNINPDNNDYMDNFYKPSIAIKSINVLIDISQHLNSSFENINSYLEMKLNQTDYLINDNIKKNVNISYTVKVGDDCQHNDNFHYHFHIQQAQINRQVNIFLSKKAIIRGILKTIPPKLIFQNTMNTDYFVVLDAITNRIKRTIYNSITDDYPIELKKISLQLLSNSSQIMVGYQMIIESQSGNILRSEPTDKEGICCLSVFLYGSNKLSLIIGSKKYFIQTINGQYFRNKENYEVTIPDTLFERVCFSFPSIHKHMINKNCQVRIIKDDLSIIKVSYDFELFDTNNVMLLPGYYYYMVKFDNSDYLNLYFKPFKVYENKREFFFEIPLLSNQLKDKNSSFIFFDSECGAINKQKDFELPHSIRNHLYGSKYFLIRLFEYTDNMLPSRKNELKELWKRIAKQLFESKLSHANGFLLFESYVEAKFTESNNITKPVKYSNKFLKRMMDIFINGKSSIHLDSEEKLDYCRVINNMKDNNLENLVKYLSVDI